MLKMNFLRQYEVPQNAALCTTKDLDTSNPGVPNLRSAIFVLIPL